jgi:hypothetical protein
MSNLSPWLKAGLIGALVVIVLHLLGIVSDCVSTVSCFLVLLVYAGIGVLAAYWLPPPRQAGTGAGQGALAAMLAAFAGGIVFTIITTIQVATTDTAQILSQMPADSLEQMRQAGVDPGMFTGPGFGAATGSICCLVSIGLAALLGAVGGAVMASLKAD